MQLKFPSYSRKKTIPYLCNAELCIYMNHHILKTLSLMSNHQYHQASTAQ